MPSKTVIKRLTHEVKEALSRRDKRGQSKHKAKQEARAQAQREQTSYTSITGLYSTASYNTYFKQAMTGLRWIAETYGRRNLSECRAYLPKYYNYMQEHGLSAWTIRTRVYAFCAVYGSDYTTLFCETELPSRHRADIKRGRKLSVTSERFQSQANKDVCMIARACGARRGGLMALTASDLIQKDGHLYVHLREKGGKERDAMVLPEFEGEVREIFDRHEAAAQGAVTGGVRRLFAKSALPKDMPLHYLRAQYAQDLYRWYESHGAANGRLYHCRAERKGTSYDKGVLMEVSRNLGHSRCDVVVSHYL